ncbi:M48 family metalloprotease [Candidatus Omnitrophota bacterium]
MPYSFTKIEKDKTESIKLVFSCLMLFYFVIFYSVSLVIKNYFVYEAMTAPRAQFHFVFFSFFETCAILLLAVMVGVAHWSYTTNNIIIRVIGLVKAEQLNVKDKYHKRFKNIVEEVSVATGGMKIDAVVVPTMAMNAFALSDFSGHHVIGVTEGLLARLNRAQIEAVVGHEAGHIVSGDCLSTTMTASLFEIFNVALKGLEQVMGCGLHVGRRGHYRHRGSGRGGGAALVMVFCVYAILALSRTMSSLLRMFISREREYRADAVAARLTRNPLALAESLYSMTHHWRGTGLALDELDSIFMISPRGRYEENQVESLLDSLFHTHPPMDKRLKVLLDMAHTDFSQVSESVEKRMHRPRVMPPEIGGVQSAAQKWMVQHEGDWKGPYDALQMKSFEWMMPEMWVMRQGTDVIKMAREDRELVPFFYPDQTSGSELSCPKCHVPLIPVYYEGVIIQKCPTCRGNLVHEGDIQRIMIREEVGFSDDVVKMAEIVEKQSEMFGSLKIDRSPDKMYKCPKCNHPKVKMIKSFYTEVYKVEIDRCFACGYVWFDDKELEVVQCMIEGRINVKENE